MIKIDNFYVEYEDREHERRSLEDHQDLQNQHPPPNEQVIHERMDENIKRIIQTQLDKKLEEAEVKASISASLIANETFNSRITEKIQKETQEKLRSVESRLDVLEAFRGGGENTFDHFGHQGFGRGARYEVREATDSGGGVAAGGRA